jgi:hypothetical protein
MLKKHEHRVSFVCISFVWACIAFISTQQVRAVDMAGVLANEFQADWDKPILKKGAHRPAVLPEEDAAGAVDGVRDRLGFHTENKDSPWWQVDLQEIRRLGRVVIYNRQGGESRARNLIILVSNDDADWTQVYRHDGSVFRGGNGADPLVVPLSDVTGRYLRVQTPDRDYMHLNEIEVYPLEAPDKNIALKKPAMQSTASQWSTKTIEVKRVSHGSPQKVVDILALANRTVDWVEADSPRPALRAKLEKLEERIAQAGRDAHADWKSFYFEIRHLRRQIVLSHPLLDFDKLLINKRPPPGYSHQCDQYLGRHSRPGPGLVVLDSWKNNPAENVLLAGKLDTGTASHPDMSFDGRRVLFSFCDHTEKNNSLRRFFIYEIDIDGSNLHQITGTPTDPLQGAQGRKTVIIEDFNPCYLPDGSIVFISTRSQNYGRCHGSRYTPAYLLYRANADGSNIRQISIGEANEWDPSVLADGRIIYTRWDYINRHDTFYQSLWVTHPDGTSVEHYYGNYSRNPCMIAEARTIPGSHKVVSTACAHHSYTSGSIFTLDIHNGRDGDGPITRITPEAPFPETEGWPVGAFCFPYPLSEDLYLVAYTPEKLVGQGSRQSVNAYGIYLVDTLGGRELIYRDPEMSCFAPIPVRPRLRPPVVPSVVAGGDDSHEAGTGTLYIQNVYQSTQPIEKGSIKRLRINEIICQPTANKPRLSKANNEIIKSIVGTAPVNDDGSAALTVPAGVPLQIQMLDENSMAVMTMRSVIYLRDGETVSCMGCHENRNSAPTRRSVPADVTVHSLTPPAGPRYAGGFSFVRTVQPVLDRYCIKCHGLKDKLPKNISLLGTQADGYSAAHNSLTNRPDLVAIAYRNQETHYSKPKDYFAHAGKLAEFLMTKHRARAHLDTDSFQRIVDWLDLNTQFYGDYSHNRVESLRPSQENEAALRKTIAEYFGKEIAAQPFAALVNVALPAESRILKAPLPEAAGGWGQISENAYADTQDPRYRKMAELVINAVGKPDAFDIAGTCGREKGCRCHNCWVRKARDEWLKKNKTIAKATDAAN